ncbi:hypothetical protein CMI40_01770 [Candidatus Pacearchaeota archaeon]|jgi:hypothetical protein|nr:hypothetical protein [Candidatus Pacearchaeota archaeon]|tara:strand:+ start:719 stop:925 length:207 start_codon:yes stop_codon:yes gene_type:complete
MKNYTFLNAKDALDRMKTQLSWYEDRKKEGSIDKAILRSSDEIYINARTQAVDLGEDVSDYPVSLQNV